jgi:hypothetical protein
MMRRCESPDMAMMSCESRRMVAQSSRPPSHRRSPNGLTPFALKKGRARRPARYKEMHSSGKRAPVPGRVTGLGFLAAPGGSSQDSPANLIIDKLSGAVKGWWLGSQKDSPSRLNARADVTRMGLVVLPAGTKLRPATLKWTSRSVSPYGRTKA